LPHNPGSPLTVYPHLGTDQSWQIPYASSPQQSRRRQLIPTPPTPSIRVTRPAGSDLAQPQPDFAAFGIYHQPQASPLQLTTNFNYPHLPYDMGSHISPDTAVVQVPQIAVKHERNSSIASNSNIPTPVSMSGPRSPLPSPTSGERPHMNSGFTFGRHISEDRSSQDGEDDVLLRKNNSYKRSEDPPRTQDGKMYCEHEACNGVQFERKCEWR
jgi:hypothetical protein